ncbi:MAG TPA: ABC transporter substrate-binding protein, partial [Gemmatimonadaceae bacterium]
MTGNLLPQPGRVPDAGARFVAAQAYETLVRVDCAGRVVPGLAKHWASTALSTTLELRDGATFWSGQPVTAHDVVAAWEAAARADSGSMAARLAGRTSAIDARRVRVSIAPMDVGALADPSLAVTRASDAGGMLEGTGPYRLIEPVQPPAPGAVLERVVLDPVSRDVGPRLVVRAAVGTAARDLVDAGVDLLLTNDPGLARYATTAPDMTSHALPWDRTYLLLTPGIVIEWASLREPAVMEQRHALARDVVRGEARGARMDKWLVPDACPPSPSPTDMATPEARAAVVAFAADDPVARALAARVAA